MLNGMEFSEQFHERSEPEQIEYLKKLASTQNHALDLMQKERDALLVKVAALETQIENAQRAYDIQKQITHDLVTQSNALDQGVAERIHELEARVKELTPDGD